MTDSHLDRLDKLALAVAKGNDSLLNVLSTGERLYVCLAANRADLLAPNDTIAEALARIGSDWTAHLVARWQYKGNPVQYPDPLV